MKHTTLKLWCYIAILTIGTAHPHTTKEAFVRGLLVAGIGVTAAPALVLGIDAAMQCNAVAFLLACADLCMERHPTPAGIAVGTGSVLATLFLLNRLERHKKTIKVREQKLRY